MRLCGFGYGYMITCIGTGMSTSLWVRVRDYGYRYKTMGTGTRLWVRVQDYGYGSNMSASHAWLWVRAYGYGYVYGYYKSGKHTLNTYFI